MARKRRLNRSELALLAWAGHPSDWLEVARHAAGERRRADAQIRLAVRRCREDEKRSLREIAKATGLSHGTIANYLDVRRSRDHGSDGSATPEVPTPRE